MTKEQILMRDILIPYHRLFATYTPKQKKEAFENSLAYNVEYLTEQTLPRFGKYKHTDACGSDYSDLSDCKTITVQPIRGTGSRVTVTICAVARRRQKSDAYKDGDLRVIVVNPNKDNCQYYFLPHQWWTKFVKFHASQGWGYINASYNIQTDSIEKWEQFRCKTFKDLARRKSTVGRKSRV